MCGFGLRGRVRIRARVIDDGGTHIAVSAGVRRSAGRIGVPSDTPATGAACNSPRMRAHLIVDDDIGNPELYGEEPAATRAQRVR